jgi:hypothetical protein
MAEKGLDMQLVAVDLGAKEQLSDAYRSVNPRVVVPTPPSCPTPVVRFSSRKL